MLQCILIARMFFGGKVSTLHSGSKALLPPCQPLQRHWSHGLFTSSCPVDSHMLKTLFLPLQWFALSFPLCRMPLSPWSGELLFSLQVLTRFNIPSASATSVPWISQVLEVSALLKRLLEWEPMAHKKIMSRGDAEMGATGKNPPGYASQPLGLE